MKRNTYCNKKIQKNATIVTVLLMAPYNIQHITDTVYCRQTWCTVNANC